MSDHTRRLEPGTLWPMLVETTRHALACGALQPITTEAHTVDDHGVAFQVRIVSSLVRKHAQGHDRPAGSDPTRPNPFLPYERDLYVGDVSDTHVCLLNKYNVLDHHMLIITRAFERQESALTRADFDALFYCLAEIDGLGFYNSGATAGASQPHKHLQIVPLPLVPGPVPVPIETLLPPAGTVTGPTELSTLPFRNAFAPLETGTDPAKAAAGAASTYLRLLRLVGFPDADGNPPPYNLLVTRRYMLLVPRTRDRFRNVSVNALGFAGSFFVRSQEQLDTLRRDGPMTALRETAQPPSIPGVS